MNALTAVAWAAAAALVPRLAAAHTPIEGIGPFYGGLMHPLVVPAHLIALIALGLLLGQHGEDMARPGLVAFGLTIIIGILGAEVVTAAAALVLPALLATACILGLLCAAAVLLPAAAGAVAAALTGLLIGTDTPAEALAATEHVARSAGAAIGATLVVFYIAALTLRLRQPWAQIGVRIIGSWTAASAALVLALALVELQPPGGD